VYTSQGVHTWTTNNSTVSNSIYSGRGPVGRPLYPQLSGHCNRPFPRDSRVFTRRLTPNLMCSRSHTKSRARLHKRTITVEQSRDMTVTKQLYKVIRYTWSQDNTLYRGIHSIHQLGKVYTKQITVWHKSIHHNRRAYAVTDNLSIHHDSDRGRQLRYAPVKQRRTQVQATMAHTNIRGRVQTMKT